MTQNENARQPRTIFEQILFGQQITNENIVALSENLEQLHQQLGLLLNALNAVPIPEPNASGAGEEE